MIKKTVTFSLNLDICREAEGGRLPVTIRMTYDRKAKYDTTNYHLSPDKYVKLWAPKAGKEYREILRALNEN